MGLLGCERGFPECRVRGGIGLPWPCRGDERPLQLGEAVFGSQDLLGVLGWEGAGGRGVVEVCPAGFPIVTCRVSSMDGTNNPGDGEADSRGGPGGWGRVPLLRR